MFDTLSDRLGSVFDRLRGRGALSEADVRAAMREVRVALLEADVALPVARDFVEQVTEKAVGQEVLRSVTPGQRVVKIVPDALAETRRGERQAGSAAAQPSETWLVVDALTGQDAVNVAKGLAGEVDLTGVILTRLDGDARGGAALSMRAVTGKPIKFAGVGEALDKLEAFHPERVAGRILGMGDVVGLVERAQETIKVEEAEALARKMAKGQFDLNDLRGQ